MSAYTDSDFNKFIIKREFNYWFLQEMGWTTKLAKAERLLDYLTGKTKLFETALIKQTVTS